MKGKTLVRRPIVGITPAAVRVNVYTDSNVIGARKERWSR